MYVDCLGSRTKRMQHVCYLLCLLLLFFFSCFLFPLLLLLLLAVAVLLSFCVVSNCCACVFVSLSLQLGSEMNYYDFVYFNMSMLKANHALTIYHWSVCELKRRCSLRLHRFNILRATKSCRLNAFKDFLLNYLHVQNEQRVEKGANKSASQPLQCISFSTKNRCETAKWHSIRMKMEIERRKISCYWKRPMIFQRDVVSYNIFVAIDSSFLQMTANMLWFVLFVLRSFEIRKCYVKYGGYLSRQQIAQPEHIHGLCAMYTKLFMPFVEKKGSKHCSNTKHWNIWFSLSKSQIEIEIKRHGKVRIVFSLVIETWDLSYFDCITYFTFGWKSQFDLTAKQKNGIPLLANRVSNRQRNSDWNKYGIYIENIWIDSWEITKKSERDLDFYLWKNRPVKTLCIIHMAKNVLSTMIPL